MLWNGLRVGMALTHLCSVGGKAFAVDLSHALVWEHRVVEATAKAEIPVDQSTHIHVLVLIITEYSLASTS